MYRRMLKTISNLHRHTFLVPSSSLLKDYNNYKWFSCGVCLNARKITPKTKASPALASKYNIITENNSAVIEHTYDEVISEEEFRKLSDEFEGINMKRGTKGVFDIEDLVELLQRENSKDIFVATVPKEINYVQHLCIVSARSKRHILALAEFVRKVYKNKCYKSDYIPRIEGKDSEEWMALDLGNIALHIFSEKTREIYDLETLWSVGYEYDKQISKTSEVVDMLENYSTYLQDLKPLA